jgi:hypothetical protein
METLNLLSSYEKTFSFAEMLSEVKSPKELVM